MSYVVMVRGTDDSFAAYGPVMREDRATSFAEWFNERVQKHEEAHPDEPDGVAWAYVMQLRQLNSKAMIADSGLNNVRV